MEKLKKSLKVSLIINWAFTGVCSLVAIICIIYLISVKFYFETENAISYGVASILFFFLSLCAIIYDIHGAIIPLLKDRKLFKQGFCEQLKAKVIEQGYKHDFGNPVTVTVIKDIETDEKYEFKGLAEAEIGKKYIFYYLKNSKLIVFEPIPKNKQ